MSTDRKHIDPWTFVEAEMGNEDPLIITSEGTWNTLKGFTNEEARIMSKSRELLAALEAMTIDYLVMTGLKEDVNTKRAKAIIAAARGQE